MKLKNVITKSVLVSLISAFSVSAFAAGTGGTRELASVDMTTTGRVLIAPTAIWDNPDFCDRSDVAIILEDNPSSRSFQAVALTAIASGLSVRPFMDSCSTTPFGAGATIPVIRNFSIR